MERLTSSTDMDDKCNDKMLEHLCPMTWRPSDHDSSSAALLGFPLEIVMIIFTVCDIQTLARCQCVCRTWRMIAKQDG